MRNFSVIIPIYNEEAILGNSIRELHRQLKEKRSRNYEIILVENGSQDNTRNVISTLLKQIPQVKVVTLPQPDFGRAFKSGVFKSKFSSTVLFNADWWDIDFLEKSLVLLRKHSIIIGSKRLSSALDKRPLLRKMGSTVLTWALRVLFAYPGSDSHGIKTFRRKDLINILKVCKTHEIIESEILIRAKKQKLSLFELAVSIEEIRPARIGFFKRCIIVSKEVAQLYKILHY